VAELSVAEDFSDEEAGEEDAADAEADALDLDAAQRQPRAAAAQRTSVVRATDWGLNREKNDSLNQLICTFSSPSGRFLWPP
jgi:hypothetical protein